MARATKKSVETQVALSPLRFDIDPNLKVATPIKGEPPTGIRKKLHPAITKLYKQILSRRGTWFHVNIRFTNSKQLQSFRVSLYNRAVKDGERVSSCSMFNEDLNVYELWVMLN